MVSQFMCINISEVAVLDAHCGGTHAEESCVLRNEAVNQGGKLPV